MNIKRASVRFFLGAAFCLLRAFQGSAKRRFSIKSGFSQGNTCASSYYFGSSQMLQPCVPYSKIQIVSSGAASITGVGV
jgi:hypothetical protein